MRTFAYRRANSRSEALSAFSGATSYIGGGTNLVDLMRQNVETPVELVDVSRLPGTIDETADGGLLIGASVRNSTVAAHPVVRARYPMLSRAILSGASGQIRNMATTGGNMLQRTRCSYFYDVAGSNCNKRAPKSGCDAIGGFNRYHAIFGASEQCIATHPSDMCVALAALDATVHIASATGERCISIEDLHRLPGEHPEIEMSLARGELITAVELSPSRAGANSAYRKVRDRSSYAFALVSVAAGLDVVDGVVRDIRIAFGGVAAKPWRAKRAEEILRGASADTSVFVEAAEAEMKDARPFEGNAFKVELAKRTLVAVLEELRGTVR